jgi:glyoxylase-like metal-dependent hydrolase (beta-lactamase superfamily II)
MQIYALSCGRLEFSRHLFFPESPTDTSMTIPVLAFLVCHPRGYVLFDTGVHPGAVSAPLARLGPRIASSYRFLAGKSENIVGMIARLGLRPDDISHVINSHLHFDHSGGNGFFPGAVFVVQRKEMENARKKNDPFQMINITHPGEYRLLDGGYDIFADGSLQLLPTCGHTPGHQSLLVHLNAKKKVFLAADACYTRKHLEGNILPATFWDAQVAMDTLGLLSKMEKEEGVHLYFGHDANQWGSEGAFPQLLT